MTRPVNTNTISHSKKRGKKQKQQQKIKQKKIEKKKKNAKQKSIIHEKMGFTYRYI
jgi:hypothetical protein